MPKTVFVIAVITAIILSVATATLTYYNRSPKVIEPLLSIFLGGVVATFITLMAILKPVSIKGQFPVSIALNKKTQLPVQAPFELVTESNLYRSLTSVYSKDDPSQPNLLIPRVVNFQSMEEKTAFYGQVVQWALLQDLYFVTSTSGTGISASSSSERRPIVKPVSFEQLTPENFTKWPASKLSENLKDNPCMNCGEKPRWENPLFVFRIPADSSLSCPNRTSIVIERPNYYKLLFTIEHNGSGNGYPLHLEKFIKEDSVETVIFTVKYEAEFSKYSAGNPDSIEVQEWAPKVFAEIKKRLADPVTSSAL